ncbi:MAG: response regulator [Spartobacteria bacterium]|nr:response regulator [Spartobacteria bacterium]
MESSAAEETIILIIDDDPAIRRSLRTYLEDYGYTLLEAADGRQGLALFDEHQPDLVMVDLRMPGMDGLDVLAYIKLHAPDVPLIVVSGTGQIGDVIEALRRGAWDYILKPVEDMTVILHALKKCLERARLIQENKLYQRRLEELVARRTAALENSLREHQLITEELRQSKESLQVIIDSLPFGIAVIGDDKVIRHLNPAALQMMNCQDPSDLLGRICHETLCPSDVGRCPILDKGHELDLSERYLITVDGTQVPILKSARRVLLDEEYVIVEGFVDISAMKRMEKEKMLLESELRQAQKMESIGHVTGGVAHDFNNLLSPIVGYSDMLLLDTPEEDPRYESLHEIHKAALGARELVRQLLAFSRKQELQITTISLDDTIRNFQRILEKALREDIELEVLLGLDNQTIEADKSQIEQVLMNLLVNARDALPSGGRVLIKTEKITVEHERQFPQLRLRSGTYARLTVSDTGTGIPPEVLQFIFEPFFTTKGEEKGTGLGLSTVYGIARQHGGHIDVESSPETGTAFHLYFPCKDAETVIQEAPAPTTLQEGAGETIVVAEDDPGVRDLVNLVLKKNGYKVMAFEDAESCLNAVRTEEGPVDLLLTDVIMPHMNGPELYEEIKILYPEIKVIFMSGHVEEEMTRCGILNLGDAFLIKPISIHALTEKIRHILDE